MEKLVAISTNGSNAVSLVKSVNEQEYKKLINDQAKHLAKGQEIALKHEEQHKSIDKKLEHFANQQFILAKSIYDNFVDRGLIEDNNEFQEMWYNFYFNDKELDLDNAPQEYNTILEKVVRL